MIWTGNTKISCNMMLCLAFIVVLLFCNNGQSQTSRRTEPLNRYCKNLPVEITGMLRSQAGEIWITAKSGIYLFNGNKAEEFELFKSGIYLGISEIKPNLFGIITDTKFILFNRNSSEVHECDLNHLSSLASSWNVNSIAVGQNDTLALIWRGAAIFMTIANEQPKIFASMPRSEYTYVFEYENNKIWLSEFKINEIISKIKLIGSNPNQPKLHYFNYYVKSNKDDIDIAAIPNNAFINISYVNVNDFPENLKIKFTKELYWKDSSDVFFNHEYEFIQFIYKDPLGYIFFKSSTQLYINYPTSNNTYNLFPKHFVRDIILLDGNKKLITSGETFSLINEQNKIIKTFEIRALQFYKYKKDSIFVVSDVKTCGWFNCKTSTFQTVDIQNKLLFYPTGAMASSLPNRLILFGRGLAELEVKTGKTQQLVSFRNGSLEILRTGIKVGQNEYILAGLTGLYKYNRTTNKIVKINSQQILHLAKVNETLIAAGTLKTGLIFFDNNGNQIHKYSNWPFYGNTRNVYSVFVVKDNIFAGTGNGIVRYNLTTKRFNLFNPWIEPANNEFNTPGIIVLNDTTLWLAGVNGVSILPNLYTEIQSEIHTESGKAFLATLKYFKQNWASANYTLNENQSSLNIPAGVTELNLEIGLEDFVNSQYFDIQYNISELDIDWKNIQPYQNIRLSNLKPGNYTLLIKCSDLRTGKPATIVKYNITINEFFYQNIFFKIAVILLSLLIIGICTYLILKNRQRKSNLIMFSKIRVLNAQINPHFMANTLVFLQEKLLTQNTQEAISTVADYAQLMRNKFEYGSKEIVSLENEIKFLENYISITKRSFFNSFSYEIEMIEPIDPTKVFIPTDLLQPLVENVFKHAWKEENDLDKILKISFQTKQEILLIKLLDNGIGYKGDTGYNSSLKNIQQRLELYEKVYHTPFTLKFEQCNLGTTISFTFNYLKLTQLKQP